MVIGSVDWQLVRYFSFHELIFVVAIVNHFNICTYQRKTTSKATRYPFGQIHAECDDAMLFCYYSLYAIGQSVLTKA